MREVDRIRQQMKQLHIQEDWAGATLKGLLADVTAEHAAATHAPWRHCIWEIVLHLQTTQQLILDRVQGIERPFSPGDEWPPISDPSKPAWEDARSELLAADEEIRELLRAFPDAALDNPLAAGGSSAYNNFHGYIQHAYYHAGQISVLKTLPAIRKPS